MQEIAFACVHQVRISSILSEHRFSRSKAELFVPIFGLLFHRIYILISSFEMHDLVVYHEIGI